MADKPMDNKSKDKDALWWQPAVGLFFELWGWLVVPVIAALFFGTWLDQKFNTKPKLLLIVIGIAFVITIYGIFRRSADMLKQIKTKKQLKTDQEKQIKTDQHKDL